MAFEGTPNFNERQVEFAIQSILMASFPWKGPIFLRVPNEQKTGADGYVKHVYPLFMQFKRSNWIRTGYSGHIPILADRAALGVRGSNYSLFFKLHGKAKHAIDFQHNILMKLDANLVKHAKGDKQGRAVYVAPLDINRGSYLRGVVQTCSSAFLRSSISFSPFSPPFTKKNVEIMGLDFGKVPFMRRHVCFPPTSSVSTANHYYSYSKAGEDIVFHSPNLVFEGARSFGSWLDFHLLQMMSESGFVSMEFLQEGLQSIIDEHKDTEYFRTLKEKNPDMDAISQAGALLRNVYHIETFLFCVRE